MGSEDFSYYLQEIPGAFALIGADDGQGHHLPCHNAAYDFNDLLIGKIMGIYARLSGLDKA
jgi:hippurate hydrolase